jgi:hypothetical protein
VVEIGGRDIVSVSGGHWAGGGCIHAEDQALVGQSMLQDGVGTDSGSCRKVGSGCRPTPVAAIKADYGLLWWLNPGGVYQSNASGSSYSRSGGRE